MADHKFGFRTRALHAGGTPDAEHGARAVPIYQSTSFVFKDTDDAANLFALQKYGNIYSRIGNPTVAAFEERMASLEGGIGAVAPARAWRRSSSPLPRWPRPGTTLSPLRSSTAGPSPSWMSHCAALAFRPPSSTPTTRPISRPRSGRTPRRCTPRWLPTSGDIADLAGLAAVAHRHDIPLVVDSTLTPPYLLRPIEHGADIVIHSATKFIGGHGTTLGGVVIESGTFNWGNGKFPTMTEPVPSYGNVSWWGNFGEYGFLTKLRSEQLRDFGPSLPAQSAFQLLQGVETLAQRMDAHLANAQQVAQWLEADDRVSYVNYAGLASHPQHEQARKLLPLGVGSVFSFGIKGGRQAGAKFIQALQLASHLANIGDARTLVLHPGSTTHQQLSEEQLRAAGVPQDLIRLSVGLEDVEDIIWDLDQALSAAQQPEPEHQSRCRPMTRRPAPCRPGRERTNEHRTTHLAGPQRRAAPPDPARDHLDRDRGGLEQALAGQLLRGHLPAVLLKLPGVLHQPGGGRDPGPTGLQVAGGPARDPGPG